MILVAGLAVAGLAGIAAAFYFSMRPGRSRAQSAGNNRHGPSRAGRAPANRSRTSRSAGARRSAGPAGTGRADRTGPSTVIDFTGRQQVVADPQPVATGRRTRHGDRPDAAAARHGDRPDAAADEPRSRRRVSWRKGSDVDEELWPAEAFGGVSDEQFWDDMAADKPLATTARTAQPEPVARRRPEPAVRRRTPEGPSTNPQPRLGADDQTAIQPVQAASSAAPQETQPYPAMTRPSSAATQPGRAAARPAEPRGRSRSGRSADEDPLTSPAYSLRPKGRVDGRSGGYPDGLPPSRQFDRPSNTGTAPNRSDLPRPDSSRPDPLRSGGVDPYATSPSPQQQPYGEPTQSMGPLPAGGRYWAGSRAPANWGGAPRRTNSGRTSGQPGGPGADDRNRALRPAYPPANGHRGPYDPRGYDRRLSLL